MTGKQMQRWRQALGETTDQFGKRFDVSGRTVEAWEGGYRTPNKWVDAEMKKHVGRIHVRMAGCDIKVRDTLHYGTSEALVWSIDPDARHSVFAVNIATLAGQWSDSVVYAQTQRRTDGAVLLKIQKKL